MNCGSCHLFPPTTHTFVSTTTQCGSCHTGWTTCTTGNQATCVAPATHVDPLAPPATTNCTSCHGTPGAGGNAAPPVAAIKTPAVGPNAIGAHQSHLTTAPSIANSLTCDDCHIPVTQLTSANHNNGTVNTQFTTARSTGTGWSGGAAGTSNCSSSWCHGGAATQAQWGRAQPNPLWNDATDSFKACNACHGNPPPLNAATHHPPNSVTACTVCHGNGYGATITGAALGTHIDPSRTINFRAGCTGCHGDVTQTGVLRTSNASAPGFNANAIDISGSPTGTRVGAHAAHLNGTRLRTTTLACSECHPVPADGDLTHADGAGNSTGARANAGMPGTLANGTILGGANTNPSYSSPNCSSVYCHGATYVGRTGYSGTNSGSPAWTQTTAVAAGCGTCHAAPPAGGTHDGARAGTANCGPCHTGYDACNISNLATCSLPGVHINGQFDPVSGGCSMCHGAPPTTMTASPAPFAGATHPQNSTCTACHGAGYTQPFTVTPSTHPSSGNVTTPGTDAPRNGCTACHGVLAGPTAAAVTVNTTVSIAPGYNGVGVDSTGSTNTNDRGVGAHDAHVRKTNLRAAALACTECHTRSLPASGDAAHSNGVVPTLEFGGLGTTGGITNAQFTGTGCSMTYCHGNFTNGKDQLAGGTPTTPGQVTGVSSPTQTNRSITLNWTAVTGAVLYKIERSDTVIGGPYVQIGTSSTNSYVDDGLWDGRTYYYRVRAWNTATVGDGAYSSPSLTQATTSSGGTPTTSTYNWHYARTGSMNGLTYNWPNTACGTYVTVTNTTQTIAPMETTVDATCAADRLYNSGSGPFYALTLVSPAYAQATVISAPSYAISLRNGTTTTNITWGFQLGYVLSGAYTMWGTEVTAAVGGTQTTVNPNLSGQTGTIPQNASLVLRIRKITATTDVARTYVGGTSSVLTVTETPSGTAPTLPAVPTGVAANFRVTGTTQDTVSLAWDPVANTSTYHVERSATAGGPTWTQIAEVAATSVTDRALTASSRYYYRVIASNPAGNSTGGYTTAAVFGDTSAAAPAGQVSWTGTFSTVATTTSLTCTSCHGNPPLGTHPTNANACSTCHGTGYSDNTVSPQLVDKALHMNGVFNVDCVGCHATAQGNRREVVSEFDGAWSHKRSETGTTKVNKWDCIVCHMEGDPATGERVTGVHGNGLINLRDPDSGNNIKTVTFSSALAGNAAGAYAETTTDATFAAFGRELGIRFEAENATSLAALQAQMVSFCLKCHDSNGATAFASGALAAMPSTTGAARSAGRPFGTSVGPIASYPGGTGLTACATSGDNGCVTDVKSSFATSNASYHPVLGRNNNSYVGSGRMRAPYNNAFTRTPPTTTVYGNLLSCWDCHAPNGTSGPQRASVTAHGGGSTLRAAVWVNNATNLCNVCHNTGASGNNHGTGSAFGSGGNSGLGTYLTQQCNVCHGSQYAVGGAARPIRGQDVHGFDKFANNMGTDTFWPVGANAQKCTAAGVPWACCTGAAAGATCTETNSGYKPYAFMRNVGTGGAWPAAVNAWKPLSGGTSPNTVPTGTATCGGSGTLNGTSACGNRTHGTYTPGGAY
jgi:predicted CxxxxCH...CXXCH cytochrome family protein